MNLQFYFLDIMPWIVHYFFWILPLCMGGFISIVETDAQFSFGWNTSNPGFTENGAHLEVPVMSNLIIKCPFRVDEYYTIYWVTKEVFENCFIPANLTLEEFLVCDSPYSENKSFELFIAEFNGVPGQKDFYVGHNYYLATLSSGTMRGRNNTWGGACKEKNMKLNITVVEKPKPTTKAPTDGTHSQTTRRPTPVRTTQPPTTTQRPTTPSPTTTTRKSTTKLKTTSRPPSTDIPDINSGDIIIDGSNNGNSAIIDANDAGQPVTFSWLIVLSTCLSLLHFVQAVHR